MSAWRLRTGFWAQSPTGVVLLVPDFEQGYIAAIREDDWKGSAEAQELADLDAEIEECEDPPKTQRLKRFRAAGLFGSNLSKGRLTIPRDIVWLVARDNADRDVTLVFREPVIEIWATRRWQDYLAGVLFSLRE